MNIKYIFFSFQSHWHTSLVRVPSSLQKLWYLMLLLSRVSLLTLARLWHIFQGRLQAGMPSSLTQALTLHTQVPLFHPDPWMPSSLCSTSGHWFAWTPFSSSLVRLCQTMWGSLFPSSQLVAVILCWGACTHSYLIRDTASDFRCSLPQSAHVCHPAATLTAYISFPSYPDTLLPFFRPQRPILGHSALCSDTVYCALLHPLALGLEGRGREDKGGKKGT